MGKVIWALCCERARGIAKAVFGFDPFLALPSEGARSRFARAEGVSRKATRQSNPPSQSAEASLRDAALLLSPARGEGILLVAFSSAREGCKRARSQGRSPAG